MFKISSRFLVLQVFLISPLVAQDVVVYDKAEIGGMSGFRQFWDVTLPLSDKGTTEVKSESPHYPTAVWSAEGGEPGAIAFDALQRMLLVRFPEAAEEIAARLDKGAVIEKVELILPFRSAELHPPGRDRHPFDGYFYRYRFNWDTGELWEKRPPQWHAIAWALRRPWSMADSEAGPTYNAYINGAGYWKRFGAQDEEMDRFPVRFGPEEVSFQKVEGRMEITPMLLDVEFGQSLGERLRVLSDNGLLVKKWETYDHRYYTGLKHGAYEWSTATGGRAIIIHPPKLAVTYGKGVGEKVSLPPSADIPALAKGLREGGKGGKPTAVLPDSEALAALEKKYDARPEWMNDLQWQRLQELRHLSGSGDQPFYYNFVEPWFRNHVEKDTDDLREQRNRIYAAWVDRWLGQQPRGWYGHSAARDTIEVNPFGGALPAPAQEKMRLFWADWLRPDLDQSQMQHPQHEVFQPEEARRKHYEAGTFDTYYETTKDWRGNKSFYRNGYTRSMSTQNFNISATVGALLMGGWLNEQNPLDDGRYGMNHFVLYWSWSGGSSQEHIDHYYFPLTVSGYKLFKDLGQTPADRLQGEMVLISGMEEVISTYHPGLKRFIAPSCRTGLEYLLQRQDGLSFMMHTLSSKGALLDPDADQGTPPEMGLYGHDVPPLMVAIQTSLSPWADDWQSHAVDEKVYPYEVVSVSSREGGQVRKSFIGRHYGVASNANNEKPTSGRIVAMAQWRRSPDLVKRAQDFATLDIRGGFNETWFPNDGDGILTPFVAPVVVQDKSQMLVVTSPNVDQNGFRHYRGPKVPITSIQSSIGFFNYETPLPTWKVYVEGKQVTSFPHAAKQGERITIHDGVSYIGILPLEATDLGRDVEVLIREGGSVQLQEKGKIPFQTALVIDSYFYKREAALPEDFDWAAADQAVGGFVVELGDVSEHGSFESFQKHFNTIVSVVNLENGEAHVNSERQGQSLSIKRRLDESGGFFSNQQMWVNDEPVVKPGLLRDSPYTQVRNAGLIEKNGATFQAAGQGAFYLTSHPSEKVYVALNPLPEPRYVALSTPTGVRLEADGRLSTLKAVVRDRRLEVDHYFQPGFEAKETDASCLIVHLASSEKPLEVVLNGQAVKPAVVKLGSEDVWIIPLGERKFPLEQLNARLIHVREELQRNLVNPQ